MSTHGGSGGLSGFVSNGRISGREGGTVFFKPTGTNYELHCRTDSEYAGPIDEPVAVTIFIKARKVYTVPSGGNFVTPIFGPPKIIQGRVKSTADNRIVVHAGANFVVELPTGDAAIDLNNGAIAIGTMVNVVALPGASLVVESAAVLS